MKVFDRIAQSLSKTKKLPNGLPALENDSALEKAMAREWNIQPPLSSPEKTPTAWKAYHQKLEQFRKLQEANAAWMEKDEGDKELQREKEKLFKLYPGTQNPPASKAPFLSPDEVSEFLEEAKPSEPPKKLNDKELERHVNQSTANLQRIYELEYKVSMLERERKTGPLPDRAEMQMMQMRSELDARVIQEIDVLHDAFVDWVDESKTVYKDEGDKDLIKSIQQMTKRLESPPEDIKGKIVLMHEALTTAHHNASMATFAYGLGRKNDWRMEEKIQKMLDQLSNRDVEPWDKELGRLTSLPRGGRKKTTTIVRLAGLTSVGGRDEP